MWRWPAALRGATYALPAALVAPLDPRLGVALAVGVIPAAVLPLPPQRRDRVAIVAIGALMAVSVLVGGLLATTPWLAILAIVALAVTAAVVATHHPRSVVLLYLALPLVGVGFSYPGLATAAPLAALFLAGATYGYAVSLPWPTKSKRATANGSPIPRRAMIAYGLRVGLAGALCAAIGFALHFEHVGWATAAAMLVMRPASNTLELRALGRAISVCAGAAAAIGFLALQPSPGYQAAAIAIVVIAATATVGSRWYITPAFTTSLVFLLLLLADPTQTSSRFGERMGETLLGIAAAILFGDILPRATARPRAGASSTGLSEERWIRSWSTRRAAAWRKDRS